MTNASPRPWRLAESVTGKLAIVDATNNGRSTASGRVLNLPRRTPSGFDGLKNAALILRAVNAHDQMREVLEAAQRYFHDASLCPPEGHRGQCAKITAALAAAEGETDAR
jgi:hypothetical protein